MTTSTPHAAPPEPGKDPAGNDEAAPRKPDGKRPPEFGGPPGPEPTRYGDWEISGRCIDF
jgi:hypothetical protein